MLLLTYKILMLNAQIQRDDSKAYQVINKCLNKSVDMVFIYEICYVQCSQIVSITLFSQ